jgi:hypothetical protein
LTIHSCSFYQSILTIEELSYFVQLNDNTLFWSREFLSIKSYHIIRRHVLDFSYDLYYRITRISLIDAEISLSIYNVFRRRETFKMCLSKLSSRSLIEKNYQLPLSGNNLFFRVCPRISLSLAQLVLLFECPIYVVWHVAHNRSRRTQDQTRKEKFFSIKSHIQTIKTQYMYWISYLCRSKLNRQSFETCF